MATHLRDITLQTAITGLINDRGPDYRRAIEEMVAWEIANPDDQSGFWGWQWQEVHTPPSIVNVMLGRGIVNMVTQSRSRTVYRVRSLTDTQEALASLDIMREQAEDEKGADIDDLFGLVIGHERIKTTLRLALKAADPVHCLLIGPPATAKSLLLSDIGRMPRSYFYVGSTTTKSGLVQLLLQEEPAILIIDEIDKMSQADAAPLLNLMETGMVTRLQHNRQDRKEMHVKIFAGANDEERVSPPLRSRFAPLRITPYTPAQFVAVAHQVLMARERLGPEEARLVANTVVRHSLDIRDAVRVARLSRHKPQIIDDVVRCLWPERR